MPNAKAITIRKSTVYACAWLVYILFTLVSFPIFNVTAMLFSIILSMIGAWLYRYPGWLFTTLLTIPYHYVMLIYSCDDPALWNEAFNFFGISTQLFISGMIAMLKMAKDELEQLNAVLEKKVAIRTQELTRLQDYIIQNHETAQEQLNHILLEDIRDSLSGMLEKSDLLARRLMASNDPESVHAVRLHGLVQNSLELIPCIELIDHLIADDHAGFSCSLQDLADHFQETAGTHFDFEICSELERMPKPFQLQLYRIACEAITNAVRHAKAEIVQITLKLDQNTYQLTVVNDGLPVPHRIETGLGLNLMQYRAQQIGGRIDLSTTPDGKTCFQCSVPQPVD